MLIRHAKRLYSLIKIAQKLRLDGKLCGPPHLVGLMQAEVVQWIENNHVLVGRMIFKFVGQDEKFLMNNNTMIWISQKALALVSNSRIAITD